MLDRITREGKEKTMCWCDPNKRTPVCDSLECQSIAKQKNLEIDLNLHKKSLARIEELKQEVEKLKKENALAAGSWQPWETAPKDGSIILACWDNELIKMVYWYKTEQTWKQLEGMLSKTDHLVAPSYWAPINPPDTPTTVVLDEESECNE
jgi:hypothetical protein